MALSYSQYSLVSYSAPKTLSLEPHLVAHPISPDASTPISPGPQITPAPPQAPGTPLRPPTSNRPQMIRKPNSLLDKACGTSADFLVSHLSQVRGVRIVINRWTFGGF